MKEVGNYTRATPQARIDGMREFLKRIHESEEASKVLSDWGLSLSHNAITLAGRLLEKPTLHFGAGQSERLTRWESGPIMCCGYERLCNYSAYRL